MGDTQTGTIGRLVVRHAEEDSSNALVPVPILGQQIKGETVACWVQLPKLRDVGRRDAQVRLFRCTYRCIFALFQTFYQPAIKK